ncbi:hypothetical protein ABZ842_07955, partial [Streptomyces sp. NPDC047315]
GVKEIRRFKVRFVDQMWPGDQLTCKAEITDITHDPDGTAHVTLALTALRQTGKPALLGAAEFVLDAPAAAVV